MPRRADDRARFIVGQDCRGCWVVRDHLEHVGGIFISRSAAYQFALHQAADDQAQVRLAENDEVIELW
ncbi:hypothetical protein AM571_PA00341 (plasmid) [Rhizobium etli 8C-3]|uniref:DUF2188 domain-containing protein n=1 Tax=Rhizobium etli 8C-3 TaxID=538025 RepID=A0A1L5PAT7_RHIET|nr:hypothetical protein AM571_PA00341 [Rhizobium etli 8C-3]